ncbi:MAG: ornithine cyclodeaminase [Rhodobacteraceae bacterium]|jgi:ornithine cyclodeaminase|nr:ornithine cyclodeaminase [Paracoccaceae bacterium]
MTVSPTVIGFEQGESVLTWAGLTQALADGHSLPRAEIGDTFLRRDPDTLLTRSAWIDGLGIAVKAATIFPGNPAHDRPSVNGAVTLYSDRDGTLQAIIDFHLVTKWKTAGDSLLAATRLAPPRVQTILVIGAGTVAHSLIAAYGSAFPAARFLIWNRTPTRAQALAARQPGATVVPDLAQAVHDADIVTCATMATEPVLRGDWLRPGQHIDLIGAYRSDMREADDTALTRARLFVDARATTLDHIGELRDPLLRGVIGRDAVVADYYDLKEGLFRRNSPDDITLFKNGGGAHLDLMTARHILDQWQASQAG